MVSFASWQPDKDLPGACPFGMFDAQRFRLQTEAGALVPPQVFVMMPCIPSIIALVIVARRTDYPRALPTPWLEEQR